MLVFLLLTFNIFHTFFLFLLFNLSKYMYDHVLGSNTCYFTIKSCESSSMKPLKKIIQKRYYNQKQIIPGNTTK